MINEKWSNSAKSIDILYKISRNIAQRKIYIALGCINETQSIGISVHTSEFSHRAAWARPYYSKRMHIA